MYRYGYYHKDFVATLALAHMCITCTRDNRASFDNLKALIATRSM